MIILADRVDRVGEAIVIARRARRIAVESIVAGMGLSILAMLAAALGWLLPVPAGIVQEVIDVAVIVNALRAAGPGRGHARPALAAATGHELRDNHVMLGHSLEVASGAQGRDPSPRRPVKAVPR